MRGCVRHVEILNPSGASEQDIDKNYKKGFKVDHVWPILKDIKKFADVKAGIQVRRMQHGNFASSQSEYSPTSESPTPASPRLASFGFNMNDNDFGGTSTERPIGRIHLWREGGGRGPLKPAAAAESPLKEKEKDPALEFKERQRAFNSQEVERRIAAIRAIQVAEVQSLLSRLRLIRSYISKEQLETPALQFFQENLPNISPVINEKAKIIELKWRITENDGGIMPDSVDVSRTLQLGGYIPHSVRSVKSSYLNIANLQIPNFVLDDPLEDQMQGIRDSFQTPGETSNRLSFGMTPKTSRQPKKGEMLMSIRGSPLGVYKEENLEAIHESGDASHGGSSQ
ncbi:uncharacterized protein LOC109820915 [Asparagus officinalis]|uniref:uncharacterized protein LOC109820915 n=1 Tax=Asparagus officinalis TaxID=4686 RepID=UPI00098DEB4C|nr:uncharacterized protein LOC109820915 [Asparagus officinalis]